jgi:hypothetical protein
MSASKSIILVLLLNGEKPMIKKLRESAQTKALVLDGPAKKSSSKLKKANLTMGIAPAPWLTSIEDLVFYALDKASPYSLALNSQTDSMSEIAELKLLDLMIDKTGLMILWTVINSGLNSFGRHPVAPAASSGCKKAKDVLEEANKTKAKN